MRSLVLNAAAAMSANARASLANRRRHLASRAAKAVYTHASAKSARALEILRNAATWRSLELVVYCRYRRVIGDGGGGDGGGVVDGCGVDQLAARAVFACSRVTRCNAARAKRRRKRWRANAAKAALSFVRPTRADR